MGTTSAQDRAGPSVSTQRGSAPPLLGIGLLVAGDGGDLAARLDRIAELTAGPHRVVVGMDRPDAAAQALCAARGVTLIGGAARGFAWTANGALHALMEAGCAAVVLLRDGAQPEMRGWDEAWRVGAALFGCVAAAPAGYADLARHGRGTPLDPWFGPATDWRAVALSATTVDQAGYIDPEAGDAAARAELLARARACRAALGVRGMPAGGVPHIEGWLAPHDAPTIRLDRAPAVAPAGPVPPWATPKDRKAFLDEQAAASGGPAAPRRPDPSKLRRAERMEQLPALRAAMAAALDPQGSVLLAEGWLASIASVLPTLQDEAVPWLNYAVVSLLRERVRPDWRVFEFGAGFSTLWWSRHVREVVAVEHHEGWIGQILPLLDPAVARILHRAPEAFPAAIGEVQGSFDVIVVDGAERPACALAALPRLSPRGVLIFDNTDRPAYAEALAAAEAAGFRQLRLTAPAPTTVKAETSSVLYRPGNCLGI